MPHVTKQGIGSASTTQCQRLPRHVCARKESHQLPGVPNSLHPSCDVLRRCRETKGMLRYESEIVHLQIVLMHVPISAAPSSEKWTNRIRVGP